MQNGSVDLGSELTHHLEKLRTLDERADKHSRDVVILYEALLMELTPSDLHWDRQSMTQPFIWLLPKTKSGAEVQRAKREATAGFATLLGELEGALQKLGLHATGVNKNLVSARDEVHGEREIILDMLHALRMSAAAAEHGLDHPIMMGKTARRHKDQHAREQAALRMIKKKEEERSEFRSDSRWMRRNRKCFLSKMLR